MDEKPLQSSVGTPIEQALAKKLLSDSVETYVYEDTDSFENEISELYSYCEDSDFLANRSAFEESMEDCGLPLLWKHMAQEQQSRAINYLMTTLEVSCRTARIKSCRALAYLVQGNFGECLSLEEQATNSQDNVFLLYKHGIFQAFVQLLLLEADISSAEARQHQQASLTSSQIYNDSAELRLIISVLCTIVEVMYHTKDSDDAGRLEIRQQFIIELQIPSCDEPLTVTLFQMLNNFCGGLAPHFPVRKITILLWKIILITLGGTDTLKQLKEANRTSANLPVFPDDTIEVTKNMQPCSLPIMVDGREAAPFKIGSKRRAAIFKQPAIDDAVFAYAKECLLNSLAELNQPDMENDSSDYNAEFNNELNDSADITSCNDNDNNDGNSDGKVEPYSRFFVVEAPDRSDEDERSGPPSNEKQESELSSSDSGITINSEESSQDKIPEPMPDDIDDLFEPVFRTDSQSDSAQQTSSSLKTDNSQLSGSRSDITRSYRGLPWAPKVRKADLIQHLANIRQKFLGYSLNDDLETLFGLPEPIIEGVSVIKKHLYMSLSEVQLDREEAMEKYPLTHGELNPRYKESATERLYSALLPRLPQYMIALLKILLAASTSSKNKSERTESINIMNEINSDSDSASIIQTMKMNADANRHKEIIIKSVSAILILLLKHFKVNHIYQFEYVSQQLMFANCIPLILKFLSQDIHSYIVLSRSTVTAIDFPACVIGEQPELTTLTFDMCSYQKYSRTNMFSCINLVRILNKLTKWKHSRIMMLVVFKSAPTLAKALGVHQSMFQLYVLKLLKVQLKFLGRPWKKSNMKLISAIYQKVRHRLTDDWAYSNDNEARPWDFQAEEFTLQANINKFHQRRYQGVLAPHGKFRNQLTFNNSGRFGTSDDCIDEDYDFGINDISQISPQFERNYERWLDSEVFQRNIDWDRLLGD